MDDDDDEFLYGAPSAQPTTTTTTSAPQPIPTQEESLSSDDVVAHLEDEVQQSETTPSANDEESEPQQGQPDDSPEEEEEEESDDDDIEIVTEAPARSLDFRQNRLPTTRVLSTNIPTQPRAQALQAALTTEYTPIARGAPAPSAHATTTTAAPGQLSAPPHPSQQQGSTQHGAQSTPSGAEKSQSEDGVDPSSLPAVKAPPSHPGIDPTEVGLYDGQSILEMDLNALADKPWRRPGSDISDWFNYGFDEISWEAYCYRRRELGELAHVLKTNIINFTAMSEDQVTALPAEMRGLVITGASNMMNQASQAMMVPGVMDMSGMVGPMGMGMNPGDMSMGGGMMPGMMPQDAMQGQQNVGMMQGGQVVDQQQQVANGVGMMQDGGFGNPNAGGMMNMGMGDYGMQEQNQMVQPMYQGMDMSQGVAPVQGPPGRGTPLSGYRGVSRGSGPPLRGRGVFSGRGRGRPYDAPPAPVRPASPLPPNVPTGPRNQNKYKDRDGNAPAVDGLDYGGGGAKRTPSHEPEERSSSRKRRSSPGLDDIRSSKRR